MTDQEIARIREVYPLDRKPCAWCGSRKSHHYDCPVPDIHLLLSALTLARSEEREEGMMQLSGAGLDDLQHRANSNGLTIAQQLQRDLTRRETEGLIGRQPAASENGR